MASTRLRNRNGQLGRKSEDDQLVEEIAAAVDEIAAVVKEIAVHLEINRKIAVNRVLESNRGHDRPVAIDRNRMAGIKISSKR